MKVVCIDPKPNSKDSDHLVYWGIYTVIQSYTSTIIDPSLQFVRETFFLLSLPNSSPKRYSSKRFSEVEEVRKARQEEQRKAVEEVIARNVQKKHQLIKR